VCVPLDNILLGEGRGFEIAQGRLGPGRVHHCMRLIGLGNRALNLMVLRASERSTFGKQLSSNECVLRDLAESRLKVRVHVVNI
jgi:acyl-CoA dehydrogenase